MQAATAALPYKHGKLLLSARTKPKAETAREGKIRESLVTLDNQLMS
ncbi:hypothetical protein ACKUV4_015415 [Acinetobacter baumannii]